MSGPPTVVIGTAGHIDHGKTSLLRALTGIDADRLPEERARGMTIDVGYAHLTFDDGVELDFVDVPGHDRLIGNMLVGAGEIDAAMLVVAADDGPRPQTLEHLQLLDALGIGAGLAVVTKIDLVDRARVAEVLEQVAELLAATTLAGVPVLVASSATRDGLDAVRAQLREVSRQLAWGLGDRQQPLRLAVDRVFAVKGRGTVVTGSLRGGPLQVGATVRREPGGEQVRVRALEVHNQPRETQQGGRTAVNLVGLPADALRRGDVLTAGHGSMAVAGADRLLVDLRPAASIAGRTPRTPRSGARVRLHLGTDQVDAALRLLPARAGTGVLTLDRPLAAAVGDRGVLREPASGAVVAGVRILVADPPRGTSRRRMSPDRLDRLASAASNDDREEVDAALTDLHGARAVGSAMALASDVRAALETAALAAVAAHHREAPVSAGLPLTRARASLLRSLRSLATVERRHGEMARAAVTGVLEDLVAKGALARSGETVRDPARAVARPPELTAAMDRLEAALSVAGPPSLDEAAVLAGCPPEGVRALVAEGRIVRLGPDLAWATSTYHRLAAVALDRARTGPLTPAAYRDATGTSRKFVMAILEDLDRRGVLQRTPQGHIPGPRAPSETGS